jgi:hypothetical protein
MAARAHGLRMRRPLAAGLYVGIPVASLFALQAPVLTLAVSVVVSLAVAVMMSSGAFIAAAAFLTAALPKAGVVVGGLPLPTMMFVLMATALMLRLRTPRGHNRGHQLALLALLWLVYRLVALVLDGGTLTNVAALAGWYGLPILLLLVGPPLGSLRPSDGRMWIRWLENGILAACGFSLVQQFLGLERTAVPGLTRAVGVDYSAKPLAFEGGSKIPSTYQNGNILGVVTGVFFLLAADRILRGRGTRRDLVIMGATALATILSGSRTAVFGLAIGLGVLMLRSGLRRQTLTICAMCVVVVGLTLQLSPALAQRLLGTSASDPALEQRTDGWSNILRMTSALDLVLGGSALAHPLEPPGLGEGFVGGMQQVGLVGMALFVAVFLVATSPAPLRRWRLILIPAAISLAVDSAFLVFPTFFLPIACMYAPLSTSGRSQPVEAARPEKQPS